MAYNSLADFVQVLAQQGEPIRITVAPWLFGWPVEPGSWHIIDQP